MSALAIGSATGRAIETHAYDALRYIGGDMLAWVHQAIAAEREFVEALLAVDAGLRKPGAVRPPAHAADEWLGEIMDAAIAGLCGPLRSRVLQTVRAQESALSAYKVVCLLQFYALTACMCSPPRSASECATMLLPRSALTLIIIRTTAASYEVFFNAIAAQGRALQRISLDKADISHCHRCSSRTHRTCAQPLHCIPPRLTTTPRPIPAAEVAERAMERALDALFDPAARMCVHVAEEKDTARRRNIPTTAVTGWDLPCSC
jgi:hypothetical protein